MDTSASAFLALVRETLSDPRAGARRVISVDIPMSARWQAFLLVIVLSVLLGRVATLLMLGTDALNGGMMASPLQSGMLQGGALLLLVFATFNVGRLMGGQGSFADTLILVTWLQALLLLVQVVQVLALLLLPPFAGMLGILGMVLFLWLLTNFVAELHGFESLGKVFGVILLTAIGLGFVVTVLMAILGLAPPEMG
ncbi:YIP1 family protein [Alkalilacustris brevis]|uniref:YIP1 family protein n=1 Tax=Alkalilacustris brevis TaxID=2026338 RepID=UPI000E0CC23F|nr:YIP1 family protein [Alkalilacustris brevis]